MLSKDLPKEVKSRRKGLIYLGLIIVLFFVLELFGVTNFLAIPTEKIFLPVQVGLHKSGSDIQNFISVVTNIKLLKESETQLAYDNSLLIAENARLSKLEKENEILRDQLDAKNIARELIVASVIGKDPLVSNSQLVIDKGKSSGVRPGNLVVVKNILIGEIVTTGYSTSRLRLLSDPGTKIPAETESDVNGLLSGQFGNQIVLEKIEQGKKVSKGEIVFTSGKSDMPKGLVLGSVEKVENDPAAVFQKAIIKPILQFEDLETVFIIKK